jgi:galactokinase
MVSAFAQLSPQRPKLFRAPGRVNIIGEHTDYNDGLVLPTATALHTWLASAPRADRLLRVHSRTFDSTRTLDLDGLRDSGEGDWSDYVEGVAWVLQQAGRDLSGADIVIDSEIPIGGGLSSSASLEVVTALALLDGAEATLEPEVLAALCRRAECEFVGVSCGIMDQYAIACGEMSCAMKLDCRSLDFDLIEIPAQARLLVVDSGVKHRLPDGGYNTRTDECAQALGVFKRESVELDSLRDLGPSQLEAMKKPLGDTLYRRCRHVVTENQRVVDACDALRRGDLEALGSLLDASHASLRDDYEVSCREVDGLVEIANACAGVHGTRMVGAGFGGCTLSLVGAERLDAAIEQISVNYGRELGREPWTHVVRGAKPAEATTARE